MKAQPVMQKFQESCKAAFLATVDGQSPRVRPMSAIAVEGNVVWMAAFADSEKMAQLAQNDQVELCYMDDLHAQLRLRGRCDIVTDAAAKKRMWDAYPLMQRYFRGLDDPQYALLKVVVTQALTMPAMAVKYEELEL